MIFARYLAREFLKVNTGIMSLFLIFFCILNFLEQNSRYFAKYQVASSLIIEYYLLQLPKLFQDALPFTVMFSAIVTFWVFARNGEVAAARAAGHSIFRIGLPLMLVGMGISIFSFVLGEHVVPWSQRQFQYLQTATIEKKSYEPIFLQSRWVRGENSLLRYETFDSEIMQLDRPQYFQFTDSLTLRSFSYAPRALYNAETGKWVLDSAVVTTFKANRKEVQTNFVERLQTTVSVAPPRILREGVRSEELSYQELASLIRLAKMGGGSLTRREVDLYQKLSLPLANFLFVFLALPFALRKERRADTYMGVVYSLVAAVIYWVGNASMRNLAGNGVVNPILAAWLVNGIFVVGAFIVVTQLEKGD